MAIVKKTYLILSILFLLIILIVVFIVFPIFNKLKFNSQELVLKKEKTAELMAEIHNLEKFKDLHFEISQLLNEIENLFIDPEIPLEFINFLEEITGKNNIKIDSLSLSDKKIDQNSWPYLVFQVTCHGNFSDFLIFLEKLENNPYLIEVQNISINRLQPNEENYFKNIKASFSIKVFAKQ